MAWQVAKYELKSSCAMLVHNGRMANPLDRFAKMMKEVSGKRSKTDADHELMARIEFMAGLYMSADGPIIPAQNIDAMLVNAAKKLKDGVSENDPTVVEKLKRVRDLTKSITENEGQIETQTKLYKGLLSKANGASERIAGALQRADQMKVRPDLGAQTANITAMLSKYNPAAVQPKLAKIDEYEQAAQGQLDGYASAAKVAADRNVGGDEEDDDVTPETDEELGSLLNDIKAKKGIGGSPAATN